MQTQQSNWKSQLSGMITTPGQLARYISVTEEQAAEMLQVAGRYKMGLSPYYAELLSKGDPTGGLRKQALPSAGELAYSPLLSDDPLEEGGSSPLKRLVHKYPDRVILIASDLCFMYCRHCTRKNTVLHGNSFITQGELEAITAYIRQTPQITDVLITGGDPLVMDDGRLEAVLAAIRSIPHVSTIRVGTRAVTAAPMRITPALADMLERYHPVWLNFQCNHPDEITPEMEQACGLLLSRGVPLGCQTVLLQGINNDLETMRSLLLKLIRIRVRPYYLYQCDLVRGTEPFMTSYREGMELIRGLWGRIPGYAVPRFVIDAPGRSGKIVVEPNNIVEEGADRIILRDYEGRHTAVPLPPDKQAGQPEGGENS
ncbi:MAG: kamA2 [Paenibacillaceae bacterium]|jgi:lysine 2,3-aminomutase|nr:kamA2 [Paenibacillaceae bacterium]